MEIGEFNGENFGLVKTTDKFKVAIIRYGDKYSVHNQMGCHLESDECFVLLSGKATVYEEDETYEMQPEKVYTVLKGKWHHIVLDKDAVVLVIENSDTTSKNSLRKDLL